MFSFYTAFSAYSGAAILLLTAVLSADVCDVSEGAKESPAVPGWSDADWVTHILPPCSTEHNAPHSHHSGRQRHQELGCARLGSKLAIPAWSTSLVPTKWCNLLQRPTYEGTTNGIFICCRQGLWLHSQWPERSSSSPSGACQAGRTSEDYGYITLAEYDAVVCGIRIPIWITAGAALLEFKVREGVNEGLSLHSHEARVPMCPWWGECQAAKGQQEGGSALLLPPLLIWSLMRGLVSEVEDRAGPFAVSPQILVLGSSAEKGSACLYKELQASVGRGGKLRVWRKGQGPQKSKSKNDSMQLQ